MPPRRSHRKSRAGCKRCKARKIKCDEVHPRCGNCLKHGVPCDFEYPGTAPAGSPSYLSASTDPSAFMDDQLSVASFPRGASCTPVTPYFLATTPLYRQPPQALPGSQPIGRLMELRLMHHYTSHTYKTLSFTSPEISPLWGSDVPNLAFAGSTHLVDAMLAVAALHMRSQCPNDTELTRASHAYMASCLNDYSNSLQRGINADNAAALFLTSTLIAFQSTASRIFTKDESPFALRTAAGDQGRHASGATSIYQPPLSWFHAFQGVKTVVAASWPWLKENHIVLGIIDSQPVLHLNFSRASEGFFGHLLDDLDEELAALVSPSTGSGVQDAASNSSNYDADSKDIVTSTRQAYQHAVATLNWAHTTPGKGALAFPATVSRRFVGLLEERKPRALVILASFLALLKVVDHVWWLHGMARREVLGIVSLFNSDYFGPDIERKWWPHLEWAVRIVLYDLGTPGQNLIPAEMWGSSWSSDQQSDITFTTHIEMFSELVNPASSLPPPPNETLMCRERDLPLLLLSAGFPPYHEDPRMQSISSYAQG